MFKSTTSKIILAGVILAIIFIIYFVSDTFVPKSNKLVKVQVKKGDFNIMVSVTGELQALNSEDIKGPGGLRTAGIWQVKISDLIPEGSIVKEGDYIATLDRTELSNKLKDLGTELSKIESQFTQTRLDTALEMRKLRDEMVNLKFTVEEMELILKQSKYEPPATIRQAELEVEKTKRTFEQEEKNYKLKLQQNKAKMAEVAASLSQAQTKYDRMTDLMKDFEVKAPKSGMLIYKKDWNGRKKKVGSSIDAWDATVATLPDLSSMISQTYVNEVDISKVKVGQKVKIGIDAFPNKKINGKVMSVANVGEQLPDNDAKVFEVVVLIETIDTTLRPGMTTSNNILTQSIKNTLYIPLDCLNGNDSIRFVYKDDGVRIVKQEVLVGPTSTDEASILAGLNEKDMIYMSAPENSDKLSINYLSKEIKDKYIPKLKKAANAPKNKSRRMADGTNDAIIINE